MVPQATPGSSWTIHSAVAAVGIELVRTPYQAQNPDAHVEISLDRVSAPYGSEQDANANS